MRRMVPGVVLAVIFTCLGVAVAAAVFVALPAAGSAPAIFDDFAWNSTANGYWHVNQYGTKVTVNHSILSLTGGLAELDRRLQTDPVETVILARVRALHFHKFGLGLGVYHAGTIGLEFDDDGVKCGRGSDEGWQVDVMRNWSPPPTGQWFYLELSVVNPYPNYSPDQLAKIPATKLKPVGMTCTVYDASGRRFATDTPTSPPPNAHYVSLDEAFLRTWDTGNSYQVDWVYAGPVSGIPARAAFAR